MRNHQKSILFAGGALLFTLLACGLPNSATDVTAPPEDAPQSASTATAPATGNPQPGEVEILAAQVGSTLGWFDGSEFVYVPESAFVMGDDEPQGSDHAPAHTIWISGYWIHSAEVTNRQYAACVAAGKCSPPARYPYTTYLYAEPDEANSPVAGVDWEQAATYCAWIDARLPSEAEWEKAAHGRADASSEQTVFPWGDAEPTCDLLNFNDCLIPSNPAPVRTYALGISPFLLYDMAGNVFEWTQDWYDKGYYAISPAQNPPGPASGKLRVYRGGGYTSPAEAVSPVQRFALEPAKHAQDLGFRCVLLDTSPAPFCQVPPLQGGQPSQPGDWSFDATGYCEDRHKLQMVGVNITINDSFEDLANYNYNVSIGGTPLSCDRIAIDRLGCSGGPLAQNKSFDIRVCREYTGAPLTPLDPTCPAGYIYNPSTGLCSSTLPEPGATGDCPTGYVPSQVGCIPLSGDDGCPAGFMEVTTGAAAYCIPMNDCLLPGYAAQHLECRRCWDGFNYNAAANCCQSDVPPAVCPPNTIYSQTLKQCLSSSAYEPVCHVQTVYVPACPTPTPPPEQTCFCCQFTNRDACNTNSNRGCWWIVTGSTSYCSGP
jgi:formylglycine-generating enzyme required for sulfatase activity